MYLAINTNKEFLENKKKQKIIIIWQARAACSSVMKMFFEELGLLTNYHLRARTTVHQFRAEYNQKKFYIFHRNNALKNPKTKYIQFTVNPFRRAVSSYIHQMRHNYCGVKNNDISFSRWLHRLKKKDILIIIIMMCSIQIWKIKVKKLII